MDIYHKYRVKIQFREKLLGGIPKSEKLIEGWLQTLRSDKFNERGEEATLGDEVATTIYDEIEVEKEEKAWTGFKRDDKGLYIEARQIEAMLKECATTLGLTVKIKGFRQHLQHGTFVQPPRLHLGKTEPDGYEELVGHVSGPRGKRAILKRHDYVERPTLEFEVWSVDNGKMKEEHLRKLFALGQENGLGCSRSQGYGKFDVLELKPI